MNTLINNQITEISQSLNSLTDNFYDFKDKEKILETVMWQGFLIGDIYARFSVLKDELTKLNLIEKDI